MKFLSIARESMKSGTSVLVDGVLFQERDPSFPGGNSGHLPKPEGSLLVVCYSLFHLIIAEISSSEFQSYHFREIFRSWKLRLHSCRNLQGTPARYVCSQTLKVVIDPEYPVLPQPASCILDDFDLLLRQFI